MSSADDLELGFAKPCGLSKKVDARPSLAAFLFISAKNEQIGRDSLN
jgi:hypothetical protein